MFWFCTTGKAVAAWQNNLRVRSQFISAKNFETTTNVVWFFKENTSKMAGNSYTPNQFGSWSMASTSRTYISTTLSNSMATISTNTTESKNLKEKSTSEVSCQNLKITETPRNRDIFIPSEYAIGARSPSVNTGSFKIWIS